MLLMIAGDGKAGDSEVSRKRRQAHRLGFRAAEGEAVGGSLDMCPGSRRGQRRGYHHTSKACPFSLLPFFSASFCSTDFSVLLGGLTACAPLCCTRFTDVHVHREVRR